MVVWHIVKIWANAMLFLKDYRISVLRNTKHFVLVIEDAWSFWSNIFEHRTHLESFSFPSHAGLHGHTKSVLGWPFLQAVLDRISDKCRVLSSSLTSNIVTSDVAKAHARHSGSRSSQSHMKLVPKEGNGMTWGMLWGVQSTGTP